MSLLIPLADSVPVSPSRPTVGDEMARMVEHHADAESAATLSESVETWQLASLNVNTASLEQLLDVPNLAEDEAQAIIAHIARHGPMQSLNELYAVEGLSPTTAGRIMPWLHVDNGLGLLGKYPLRGQISLTQRVAYHVPLGVQTSPPSRRRAPVLGSPVALQTRVVLSVDQGIQTGLKGLKASGEPAFNRWAPYGYGFYSGYAQADLRWPARVRIVLGDHALRLGYGLVLATGSLSFVGTDALAWGHLTRARGAFALSDGQLLRGLSVSLRMGRLRLLAGCSAQKVNARLMPGASGWSIRTLKPMGPFRTESTLRNRRSTWELVTYANAQYAMSRLVLGLSAAQVHYQFPMQALSAASARRGEQPPQDFVRVGPYFSLRTTHLRVWGEGSTEIGWPRQSHPLSTSFLAGVAGLFASRVTAGLMVYSYAGTGHTVYQRIVAPTAQVRHGGRGLQMAVEGYLHREHHLYATAQLHAGSAQDARTAWQPERIRLQAGWEGPIHGALTMRLLAKHMAYMPSTRVVRARQRDHQELRLRLAYQPETGFGTASHGAVLTDLLRPHATGHWGWALFQDLSYRHPRLELCLRVGYMHLGESPSGLYIYEPGPAYAFGMRRFALHGLRGLLHLHWHPMRSLDLWGTVGHTLALASPVSADSSAHPLELMLQLRWSPLL